MNIVFWLSPGNAHSSSEEHELLDEILCDCGCYILMDNAYKGDDTRKKDMEHDI